MQSIQYLCGDEPLLYRTLSLSSSKNIAFPMLMPYTTTVSSQDFSSTSNTMQWKLSDHVPAGRNIIGMMIHTRTTTMNANASGAGLHISDPLNLRLKYMWLNDPTTEIDLSPIATNDVPYVYNYYKLQHDGHFNKPLDVTMMNGTHALCGSFVYMFLDFNLVQKDTKDIIISGISPAYDNTAESNIQFTLSPGANLGTVDVFVTYLYYQTFFVDGQRNVTIDNKTVYTR